MAHLLVRGLMKRGGVDFFDTFSPTPVPPSITTVASESQVVNFIQLPDGCGGMHASRVRLSSLLSGLPHSPS